VPQMERDVLALGRAFGARSVEARPEPARAVHAAPRDGAAPAAPP
jgi:hypothetical protein